MDVLARTRSEVRDDRVTLVSAGVAFYALLALVPALVALISIYALVADPANVESQVGDWLRAAPLEVRELLASQLRAIAERGASTAGLGVGVGVLAGLWSASNGVDNVVKALNIAYDEEETRGFVHRRGLSLLLTLGAVAFVLVAVGLIAVVPALLDRTGLGGAAKAAIGALRWVLLLAGMATALAVLYRVGPDRDPRWNWLSPGAVGATVLWLVASAGFSIYTSTFAGYERTYGSLGAIVVLMLWLWITSLCVVLGAELNAELEHQTRHDTTTGTPRPMGQRDAHVADTLGASREELSPAPRR